MARFSPEPCLLRTVRLTRTAYAQLVGQKFYNPRIFGRWQEKEGSPQWRCKDLGMKIVNVIFESDLYSALITKQACGFEMLYQEGRSREKIDFDGSSTAVSILLVQAYHKSHQAQKDALQRDPEFIKYVNSIRAAGYFRDEIEGSQLWDALESKALTIFLQSRREE